jgi:hypothetical protein
MAALVLAGCDDGGGGGGGGGGGSGGGGDTVVNAWLNLAATVTRPARGAAAVAAAINTAQFTGTVAWKENDGTTAVAGNFAASTVYKALITLEAKSGFTFTGFAGTFTYAGADVSAYAAGVVTITFPPTFAQPFTAIDAAKDYLIGASGGGSADTPVPLPVELSLASDWATLLGVIKDEGKFVDLDLSACTMTGEFDPGAANTGKDKVVSLVLPDAATSIKAGDYSNSTFRDFSALKSVSGSNIITVGTVAFWSCEALTTVDLPKATTIDNFAFFECYALTSVNLPEATTIGNYAFRYCTHLTEVSLPAATDIGEAAFAFCETLTTVSLPKARSIGEYAFSSCAALTEVDLPAATSIGNQAFAACTALTEVNLPEATSIGQLAFSSCVALTTVTLGSTAPTLGSDMFFFLIFASQTVTVKVPSGATGYGTIPATYSGSDTTANWGTGFRGGGWENSKFTNIGLIKSYITLVIQYQ